MAGAQWKVKPQIDVPGNGIWLGPGARNPTSGVWFGYLAEAVHGKSHQVWMATAKEQVIGLVGKRGSGKSFTLGTLLEGLCVASGTTQLVKGTQQRAALLFDPLDIYWTTRFPVVATANTEVKRHYDLAKAAQLTDLHFSVDAWLPGELSRTSVDPAWFKVLTLRVGDLGLDEWSALLDVSVISDPMGQALADSIELTLHGFESARGHLVPAIEAYGIPDLINASQAGEIINSYHTETIRALRQRLRSLEATGLFSARGVPLNEMLSPGKLSVILLGRLPQAYRAAVVAVLTRLLIRERSEVAFAEKRLALDPNVDPQERSILDAVIRTGVPRTIVALDEAQGFLSPGPGNVARDIFIQLVKEGRNIGISAILATQQPSALDRKILSQVETFIAHQLVTEPDIQAVRDNLKSAIPEGIEFGRYSLSFADMLRMLAPGQCVVSAADMNTTLRRCIAVTVRPRATVHGGIEL